ncbi:hypothetical protein ABVT39_008907, partial [Epinephelus coioides]
QNVRTHSDTVNTLSWWTQTSTLRANSLHKHLKHYHKYFFIHIYPGTGPGQCCSSQANRKYLGRARPLSQHQHDAAHFAVMTMKTHTCVHTRGKNPAIQRGLKSCQEWQRNSWWMITTRR